MMMLIMNNMNMKAMLTRTYTIVTWSLYDDSVESTLLMVLMIDHVTMFTIMNLAMLARTYTIVIGHRMMIVMIISR